MVGFLPFLPFKMLYHAAGLVLESGKQVSTPSRRGRGVTDEVEGCGAVGSGRCSRKGNVNR